MKRYLAIIRSGLISQIFFRSNFIFSIVGSLLQMVLIYFLWKSIYAGQPEGLSSFPFMTAFTYLAVSGTIRGLVETWMEYPLSNSIIHGGILIDLILPMDLHFRTLANAFSLFIGKLITTAIPSFLVLFLVFKIPVPTGPNALLFSISVIFSLLISVNFEFFVGVSAFELESILGVKFVKDSIILFFSGAVIPIPFFPEAFQKVLMVLPFQAMYHTPASIFLGSFSTAQTFRMLLVQLLWLIFFMAAGRLFYRKLIVRLTINGG